MGTDFYAFEMLTGRRLVPLPVASGTWSIGTNADDSLQCKIPARAAVTALLDVWGTTPLARTGLLAVVDGMPVAAGPIWKRKYSQGKDIDLTAGGIRSYWERRLLLPVAARTNRLVDGNGDPIAAYDTNLSGLSYGTIAKRYIELMQLWPGGAIPMQLPADEAGPYVRNVAAIDLKKVRALIDALSNVENGPDISFRPRWSPDGLGIYWEMTHGSVAKPRLGNDDPSLIGWTVGATSGGAFDLEVEEDGTNLAEEVFAAGGRSGDRVLIARGRDATLHDAGFPLMQAADTAHSDVVEQTTMQSYANRGAALGKYPSSFWKMKVRAHEKGTIPLGDYWLGDVATVTVDKSEPVLPAGDYVRRIASIGGDAGGESFNIAFAEAIA